eukprot:c24895_g1_i1 orf=706-2430(-)
MAARRVSRKLESCSREWLPLFNVRFSSTSQSFAGRSETRTVLSRMKTSARLAALTSFGNSSVALDWEVGSNEDRDRLLHSINLTSDSSSAVAEEPGTDGKWKMLTKAEHGLDNNLISSSTWEVLKGLHKKGYEAYLVGGSVRDMLLKQVPKDFDVLTTAELMQIKRLFSRSMIVSGRFPICHVTVSNNIVEVSSFSTKVKVYHEKTAVVPDSASVLRKVKGSGSRTSSDIVRYENCLNRDLTINGLMYDPFKDILYDYVGGIEDLKKMKVRTIIPADKSFEVDCARLLRAIRIGGRLGLMFSRDTARAIQDRAVSIMDLNKGRLMMEVNYMLAYGAADATFRLLWRFGVLEILLPLQAAYLASMGFKRREKRSNMLLDLLRNLDAVVAPNKPCDQTLWLSLLALHLALVNHPQHRVVISAFVLAIYSGKGVKAAVMKAKRIQSKYGDSKLLFPEIDTSEFPTNLVIEDNVWSLQNHAIDALHMMGDKSHVMSAMSKYPEAPISNVVLLTKTSFEKCTKLFKQADDNQTHNMVVRKRSTPINYEALAHGHRNEVSFVLSRILLNTLYPGARKKAT